MTVDNFQELFAGILNSKDLEGLRLLVTQFPQQQFNATADRKTEQPLGMQGVACFDCHVNGHTSGGDAPGGRHPAAVAPPPHRHAQPARRQHPAAVRLAAGAEDGRGLHRVRAAGGLLRRRQAVGGGQGDQSAGARQPGPLHVRVAGVARFPAGAGLGMDGKLDPKKFDDELARNAGPEAVLRQGPVRHLPSGPLLHRQLDARPEGRAVLQAADRSTA